MNHGDDRPEDRKRALDLEPQEPDPPKPAPAPEPPPKTPTPPAPAPAAPQAPPAGTGPRALPADHFNVVDLPFTFLRILRDPTGGIARVHVKGRGAFLTGAILGGVALLVMAWFQVAGSSAHRVVLGFVGGAAFFVAAVFTSLVLRATVGSVRDVDWHDDVFIIGCALCFSLAGFLLGGPFLAAPALRVFAAAAGIAGFSLMVFALHGGLVTIGRLEGSRAVWITAAVLAAGTLASSALGFLPVLR